jgi:hypothetical protein
MTESGETLHEPDPANLLAPRSQFGLVTNKRFKHEHSSTGKNAFSTVFSSQKA